VADAISGLERREGARQGLRRLSGARRRRLTAHALAQNWPRYEDDVGAEEAEGDRAPAKTGASPGTAVEHAEVEDQEIAGLDLPRDDVPVRSLGLDVKEALELAVVVEAGGVVGRIELGGVVRGPLV
jgi:hypothetical protein